MTSKVIFISGIGTNIGKSYATGWLACRMMAAGKSVITQKMIQTGNTGSSEDIDVHRKIMGMPLADVDIDHTTAPVIFTYPASPHLAAEIDNRPVDLHRIDRATAKLSAIYDIVLMEGAGGLMVPISEDYLTIDFICDRKYPVALVTNGSLGSINHTILSFEALKSRNIDMPVVIYNSFFDDDPVIAEDNQKFLRKYFSRQSPNTEFLVMPRLDV